MYILEGVAQESHMVIKTSGSFLFMYCTYFYYKNNYWENQDGGLGRHTAPPRTTRADRKLNGKEVRHQGDKKETYIQMGRRGGDWHGGGEDSRGLGQTEVGRVWDKRGRQSDH